MSTTDDSHSHTPLPTGHGVDQLEHNKALGIRLVSKSPGAMELALDWRADLTMDDGSGVLASGPIVSILDNACGYAIWSALDQPRSNVTLNLRIDYLRVPTPGKTLFASARCHRVTKRIAFAHAIAHEGDESNPIADASASFFYTGAAKQ